MSTGTGGQMDSIKTSNALGLQVSALELHEPGARSSCLLQAWAQGSEDT